METELYDRAEQEAVRLLKESGKPLSLREWYDLLLEALTFEIDMWDAVGVLEGTVTTHPVRELFDGYFPGGRKIRLKYEYVTDLEGEEVRYVTGR